MGNFQAEEPKVLKVSLWPAHVVIAPADTFELVLAAQYAPQAAPNPPVQGTKGPSIAMLEVLEPSPARAVHIDNNGGKAAAMARPVFRRIVSLNFFRLFLRGQRVPRSK